MMRNLFLVCLIGLSAVNSLAQSKGTSVDLLKLAKTQKLQVFNRTVTPLSEGDKKGISLSAKENDGVVWVAGTSFSNGTIELDIRGKDIPQGSFLGVAFHGVDEKTLDAVYFRPFNFQTTDAIRKNHAVQYVSHPNYPWQRLRKDFDGQYEKAVEPAPNPNEWFHVKIVVKDAQIAVYTNKQVSPCLTVKKLSTQKTGKLGLWVGNSSGGDFANLTISPISDK